jgi:DNA invertase Pin-like site-specific DNA recombinase
MAGSPKKSPAGGTWDGIYDPCRPNDRLLLNMKGSISEFAVLRARMLDAARAKARRGELRSGSEWDVRQLIEAPNLSRTSRPASARNLKGSI